jgi:8-oxo-dGTP pyrophosphatase MutT (NUDIX family)
MEGGDSSMKRLSLSGTRRALEPALRRVLHVYWRFARAMTLGVRALVHDQDGRIFLVKYSYVSGWHLLGGGVEAGETLARAVARDCARRAISR